MLNFCMVKLLLYVMKRGINNSKRLIYIDFTTYENNFIPSMKIISYPNENNFTHNNKINNKNEYMNEIIEDVLNCNWLEKE